MNPGAVILAGVPPLGLSRFCGSAVQGDFDLFFLNYTRADRDAQVATVRAKNARIGFWAGPARWEPSKWRESIDAIRQHVRTYGAVHVIVDPENVWPSLEEDERRTELRAFGAACGELANEVQVSVTTYPGFPDLDAFAEGAGGRVSLVLQIYGKGAFDAATFAAWFARGVAIFGVARVAIATAGWSPDTRPVMDTREGFDRYLSMLPPAPGWVVFSLGEIPPHMLRAYAEHRPGGSIPGDAAQAVQAFTMRPEGAVALAVAGLLLLTLVLTVRAAST